MATLFWWFLGKCGLRVGVDRLVQSLTHASPYRRKAASKALRGFREARAVSPLLRLLGDSDDGVFCTACGTIALYGAQEAVDPLYPLLNSDNKRRLTAASSALEQLGEGHVSGPYLRYMSGDAAAAEEVKNLVDQGNQRLVALLMDRLAAAERRDRKLAAELLVTIANDAVVVRMIQRLDAENAQLRCELCLVLGKVCNPLARRPLNDRLNDPDPKVVCAAIEALRQIADPDDFEPIAKLLDDENRDSTIRLASLAAIIALDRPKARDRIMLRLGDRDTDVRCAVIEAVPDVCDQKDDRAVDELIELLTIEEPVQVREAACRAAGKLGNARAVVPLMDLLKRSAIVTFEQAVGAFQPVRPTGAVKRMLHHVGEAMRKPWDFPLRVPDQGAIQEAMDELGKGALMRALQRVVFDGDRTHLKLFREMIRSGDLTAVDVLVDWWPAFDNGRKDPTSFPLGRIREALAAIESSLGGMLRQLFCREHLTRFEWQELRSDGGYTARYPVCRTCKKTAPALTGIRRAICIVDGATEPSDTPELVRSGHDAVARWAEEDGLWDFDGVEIRGGDQWRIDRFRIQVESDRDPARKGCHRKMACIISPDVDVPEYLLSNLRDIFGKVIRK